MNQLFAIVFIIGAILVGRPSPEVPTTPPTLTYKDILPVFEKTCSMCHNSSTPDRNWLDYHTAFRKRERIKLRLQDKSMPIGIKMLENERQMVINWIQQGAQP